MNTPPFYPVLRFDLSNAQARTGRKVVVLIDEYAARDRGVEDGGASVKTTIFLA